MAFINTAKSQDNYPEILQAIKDTSYPMANYYLDKVKEYSEDLARLKLFVLFQTSNFDDMCQYITKARRLGFEDDLLMVSFLISMAVKTIPVAVLADARAKLNLRKSSFKIVFLLQ